MSQQTKKPAKQFDDYENGNGPRPPVPGEESNMSKMTSEGGAAAEAAASAATAYAISTGASNVAGAAAAVPTNKSPPPPPYPPSQSPQPSTDSFSARATRWQQSLEHVLADKECLSLFLSFVRDGGEDSKHYKHLTFYFACEGLKGMEDMTTVRKLTRKINDRYLKSNIVEATPELRAKISQILRNEIEPQPCIFDDLQKKVEQIIEKEVYPAFVTSEVFVEYVRKYEEEAPATESWPEIGNVSGTQSVISSSSKNSLINGVASASGNTVIVNTLDDDSGTTYSRMNADYLPSLITTSNLQTLHEDTELKLNAKSHSTKPRTSRPMPKLTEDLLLATQKGRLEVRPQGAVGYTYSVPFNSSYNPVSRQDSERQSLTSDSEVNSKDGKPYMHRRPTAAEDYRKAHVNPQTALQKTIIKPLNQGLKESVEPISQARMENARYQLDAKVLYKKLEKVKHEQEKELEQKELNRAVNARLNSAAAQPRAVTAQDTVHMLRSISNLLSSEAPRDDVDCQSILDMHVSSVFSPRHTPGTTSPKNMQRSHHRSNVMSTSVPDFAMPPIRHSRSIPENASFGLTTSMQYPQRRPPHTSALHRCPSQNIDSGISLYSADIPYNKAKEMKPIDQYLDEPMRRSSKDDSRRSRKQLPLPQQQLSSMSQPMLFQPSLSPIPPSSSTSSHHTMNELPQEHTFAHYHFIDEKIPYRIKIPSKRITLKLFKEHLPRKGNFRYFFQTTCDDPENPVVQEEVVKDSDMVPIYEGKVIASLRLVNE